MEARRNTLIFIALTLIALAGLAGLTYANHRFSKDNPGGSDFLPRWVGTQLLMLEGQSPYSDETTRAIQQQFYGRPARPDEDQVLFVYPLFSILVFGPFAAVKDFTVARALWMTTLEVSILGMVLTGVALSRWRAPRVLLVVLCLFSLLWYHGGRAVVNGNVSVICGMLIAVAFLAVRSEHDVLAGFLLAMAGIKPQMVVLLYGFVLIWAISRGRWLLFWSLISSLVFLTVGASLLIPDWLIQNIQQIVAYPGYTLPGSPGGIFASWFPGVGRQMGWLVTILVTSILIVEWRAGLGKEFRWFLWTASLTLTLTNLIGIRTATENYIALLPVLVLIFGIWDQRWGRAGRWLVIISILLLFFGLWGLFLETVQPGEQPIQHSILFFPLPIFLVVGLYWIRWWAVRPLRPILDQFRSGQDVELI